MFLITLLVWTVLWHNVELVLVRVEQGLLRGEPRNRSTGNGQFCSFKGIPYAAPPIGKLRFKAPQPALPWEGERKASAHGSVCPQTDSFGKFIPGDEDCLFLNVYTLTVKPNVSMPVMFYIHGGAFVTGSGNEDEYGPDLLLDHNVVIVTINYRLGALGFLNLDIKEAPGNAGLKDQVAALRWVKRNIKRFGGDPENVTIFGQNSGGVSVSLHALSPMSKGLFKRGIIMSTVFLNDIAYPYESKRQGLLLAHKIGLYTKNPLKAFNFLQNASVEAVITTRPNILAYHKMREDIRKYHVFPSVVEKDFGFEQFMVKHPEELLFTGETNEVDLIIGHTSMEGVTRAIALKDAIFEYYPFFDELIVPSKILQQVSPDKVLKIADRIHKHYFGNKARTEENMKEYIKVFTYVVYVYDIHRYLEMWTKGGNRAYFYEFSCFSERNIFGRTGIEYGIKKASHMDDLMYVFDGKKYNLKLNREQPSYKMIVQTCKLLTNFAKYGNPTPDKSLGPIWLDYSKNQSVLNIGLKLKLEKVNTKPEIDFWRRIFKKVGLRFS